MENSISIKNLHRRVDVAALCEAFQNFGRILSANIEIDKNMESIGKAEVTFDNHGSALNSVKFMNGQKMMKKTIHVTLRLDDQSFKKVFVKNLSKDWDEADLIRVFAAVGEVADAGISEESGKSNGYGFVKFHHCSDAEKAVNYFKDKEIDGHRLHVERFKCKSERCNAMQNSIEHAEAMLKSSTQKDNLHIKNLPREMDEDALKEFFQKYGLIKSHKIAYDENGRSRGFGFVCYHSVESAAKAQKRTNGIVIFGKKLEVDFKQDGFARKHYLDLKNKESELKDRSYKQRSRSLSALQFHPHSLKHTLMKI